MCSPSLSTEPCSRIRHRAQNRQSTHRLCRLLHGVVRCRRVTRNPDVTPKWSSVRIGDHTTGTREWLPIQIRET